MGFAERVVTDNVGVTPAADFGVPASVTLTSDDIVNDNRYHTLCNNTTGVQL